jgi:hypothetical protein
VNHISTNKSRIGSIEVPIERAHPDEQTLKFLKIVILFLRIWLAFKVKKTKKEALGRIGCATRLENLFLKIQHSFIHPEKISNRHDYPYPFKSCGDTVSGSSQEQFYYLDYF